MGIVSVANYGKGNPGMAWGQSFNPNAKGPDGSGPPQTATVRLTTVAIGYPTYASSGRCETVYIYDTPLPDPSAIGRAPNLMALSSAFDDTAPLGTSHNARTFRFYDVVLQSASRYYIYFVTPQMLCITDGGVYGSEFVTNFDWDEDPLITLQFEVKMEEI